jgi:hypothetical protein
VYRTYQKEKEESLWEKNVHSTGRSEQERLINTIMEKCRVKHQQAEFQVRRRDNKGENEATRPHAGEEFRKPQRKRKVLVTRIVTPSMKLADDPESIRVSCGSVIPSMSRVSRRDVFENSAAQYRRSGTLR